MPTSPHSVNDEQVRRFDNDRFVCMLFAPEDRRPTLMALLAFNLEVARIPEVVRETLLARIRLQWWRDAVAEIYAGGTSRSPILADLAPPIAAGRLSRSHFDRLLDARERDLDAAAPDSLDELIDYVEGTAGSLQALALELLVEDGGASTDAAREVGIAWGLTGLLRAVPFHARARRMYLPADLNRAAGVNVFDVFERGVAPGLAEVARQVADVAEAHLRAARGRRRVVSPEALPVLLPATIADIYLKRLRRAAHNPFDPRLTAPSGGRLPRLLINRLRNRY